MGPAERPRGSELPIPHLHRLPHVPNTFLFLSISRKESPTVEKQTQRASKPTDEHAGWNSLHLSPSAPSRSAPVRDLAGVDHARSTTSDLGSITVDMRDLLELL
jgi:hypothetical protein